MHLLVPYASALAPGCEAALRGLALPRLEALLARLALAASDESDEFNPSTPHERALARLRGLSPAPGLQPWAALSVADEGGHDRAGADEAFAWITPCHWQIAPDHISLLDPARLGLEEAESRALLAVVSPYFREDGIVLEYRGPSRWLARGEIFRGLPSASLDRVSGRSLDLWMPDGPAARPLRRLQTEVQMLLYTHALTDERNARGLPAVNAFWVSGSGALPAEVAPPPPGLVLPEALREAALREDWAAWRAAWQALDAGACADALRALADGQPLRLTLCGERTALEFAPRPRSLAQRLRGLFAPGPSLQDWAGRL